MSAVEISYKGSQIASMDATGVKTLLTGDTFCEDDIVIQYTAPSAPTPTGTKQITISGAGTVTEDVTNYANAEITTPSGTAGTPTATKGVVSNHSVSVTPSVTNATGFITGSTKTGAAVTVSASELVSGSETKTENGTYDVTNLAELIVNVSGGGGSSNIITGTFTAEAADAGTVKTISLSYNGSGFPIAVCFYVTGGKLGNTTNQSTIHNKGVVNFSAILQDMTTQPNYVTGTAYSFVAEEYKNSTTSATKYTTSVSGTSAIHMASRDPSSLWNRVLCFSNNTTMKLYVAASGNAGFMPGIEYTYYILYSS